MLKRDFRSPTLSLESAGISGRMIVRWKDLSKEIQLVYIPFFEHTPVVHEISHANFPPDISWLITALH